MTHAHPWALGLRMAKDFRMAECSVSYKPVIFFRGFRALCPVIPSL